MLSISVIYQLLVELDIAGFVFFECLIIVFSFERIVSHQQHVSDNAKAK